MYKSEHLITSRHYLILGVIAFAAGIFLTTNCNAATLFTVVVFISAVFVVLITALAIKLIFKSKRLKHILLPVFLIFCCLAGCARILVPELLAPGPLEKHLDNQVWLTGTVVSEPKLSSKGWSYSFEFEAVQLNDTSIPAESIIVYIPTNQGKKLSVNDKICCWTKICRASGDDVSNNYDYYTHLCGRNIFYTGYTTNANPAEFQKPFSIKSWLADFGKSANRKICHSSDSLFGNNTQHSALLKGILVGNKEDFTDALYNKFSYSGLSHIVSVSGMHLSILYSSLLAVFNLLRIRKRYTLLISLPLLLIFTSTAAFTPSVCRAVLMYLLMQLSRLFKRQHSSLTALFFSLGVILLFSPYALYSKSLTLSFCAALGILLYYKYAMAITIVVLPFKKASFPSPKAFIHKVLKNIFSSLIVSTSVTVTTFGFSALFFGRISYIQLFTNLWVVPIVIIVFILGYIACIVNMIFPGLATFLSYPLGWLLDIVLATAHVFGKEQFTIDVSGVTSAPSFLIICLSAMIFVYMTLKVLYDTHMARKKRKLKLPLLR